MRVQAVKHVHYDSGPNMTPLVDVVMVILIFLMLAGSFAGGEHYLVSTLPVAGPSQSAAGIGAPAMEIYVDSAGGSYTAHTSGLPGVSDTDALVRQLVQTKVRLGNGLVGPNDMDSATQVIINPGSNVRYQCLVDVYQAALDAKFSKVGFATGR